MNVDDPRRSRRPVMSTDADTLARRFAANLLDAVAEHVSASPEMVLRAASAPGQVGDPEIARVRSEFSELAFSCFPTRHSPSRTLSLLCRGETQPRPMCEVLAALGRELGVPVASLFAARGES